MDALQPDSSNPLGVTRRRRRLSLRRRLANAAAGAASGGAAGWISVWVAGVDGALPWWIIGGLAALGAAFGYRYGLRVVVATFKALGEAAAD